LSPEFTNWGLFQHFDAVVRNQSLSKAAEDLGVSQPTVSRQIAALEAQLGLTLFDRTSTGLVLTPAALELVAHIEAMANAARNVSIAAGGQNETIRGSVRITTAQMLAHSVMSSLITGLRKREPEIDVELVVSDATENLIEREADIAIRMYRPDQADVIARKVGELKTGIYASKQYLKRKGTLASIDAIEGHDFVGYDRSDRHIRAFKQGGVDVERSFFPFRCDSERVCWDMVVNGYGIGSLPVLIAENEKQLVEQLPTLARRRIPVWLACHRELRTSRRLRRVYDFLGEALGARLA